LDVELYPARVFGTFYDQSWRVEKTFKRVRHCLTLEVTPVLGKGYSQP